MGDLLPRLPLRYFKLRLQTSSACAFSIKRSISVIKTETHMALSSFAGFSTLKLSNLQVPPQIEKLATLNTFLATSLLQPE